jgi:hypothetical protein
MDHAEAIQTQAAEKYLLGEFSASKQNEFAEHFFDCEECANDLRITSLFLDTTKNVLAAGHVREPRPAVNWWTSQWRTAGYPIAASIVFLAFILYQNAVVIPELHNSSAPQALEFFSLGNMGSRGGAEAVITPNPVKPFILTLDLPPQENVTDYRCEISGPNGNRVLSIDVSEALAKKTVPLLIPASVLARGNYLLTISGRSKDQASYAEIERYPFQVM